MWCMSETIKTVIGKAVFKKPFLKFPKTDQTDFLTNKMITKGKALFYQILSTNTFTKYMENLYVNNTRD